MSEIAKRADLVIGSLYQYFTDKSAIFRAILIRHQAEARMVLHHYLAEAHTLPAVTDALTRSFDDYFAILQTNRLIAALWPMVQTDPELQALDLEDTLQNARYIAGRIDAVLPGIEPDKRIATCTLLIQFSLYSGRLALDAPPEIAREIPSTFKKLLRQSISALQEA